MTTSFGTTSLASSSICIANRSRRARRPPLGAITSGKGGHFQNWPQNGSKASLGVHGNLFIVVILVVDSVVGVSRCMWPLEIESKRCRFVSYERQPGENLNYSPAVVWSWPPLECLGSARRGPSALGRPARSAGVCRWGAHSRCFRGRAPTWNEKIKFNCFASLAACQDGRPARRPLEAAVGRHL